MKHWIERIADELNEMDVEKHVIASGTSISGSIHIGNSCDVFIANAIGKALRELGNDAETIWIADDHDPLRKVPFPLPESYDQYLFPKFKEDVFWLDGTEPKRFMAPTAETSLVNLHRNEILAEADLPKKYFAYTPCYRCEAGSYRTEERGMIRGYQFNKVEMVQYTTENGSDAAFEELLNKAKSLVEKLGLHFQVSKLAAGDCSHSMARTYDVEVWIPSMGIYKEVSSASNARDYQARRGQIRYRDAETKKTKFCHTLNASGLATSRLVPAIVEQFQNADGSVNVPEVLQPFMGGVKVLYPIKK